MAGILQTKVGKDAGTIPTANVFITPFLEDMKAFEKDLETPGVIPKMPEDPSRSFFFAQQNSSFLSFRHSVGWAGTGQPHYELEVLDPSRSFETLFIEHYFNEKNIYEMLRNIYITYGTGSDIWNWAPGQRTYLLNVGVEILSSGARKYILKFGPLPSLLDRAGVGVAVVDQWGRKLLSKGKVYLNDGRATNSSLESMADLMGGKGGRGRTPAFIDLLDDVIHMCIQNYIENVTQLEGNVIILIPSLHHTMIESDWSTGLFTSTPWKHARSHDHHLNLVDVLETLLNKFGQTENDEYYSPFTIGRARKGATHAGPTTKIGIHATKFAEDDVVISFGARSEDIREGRGFDPAVLDWNKPLQQFGKRFVELLLPSIHSNPAFGSLEDDPAKKVAFGVFTGVEIADEARKNILQEEGFIDPDSPNNCYIWGDSVLIDGFLGQLRNPVSIALPSVMAKGEHASTYLGINYYDKKGVYKGAGSGNPKLAKISKIHNIFTEEYLEKISGREEIRKAHEQIGKLPIYEIIKSADLLVKEQATATHLQLFEDAPLIPILKANVRNPNVLDMRMTINPHYWAQLMGTTESEIMQISKTELGGFTKRVVAILAESVKGNLDQAELDSILKDFSHLDDNKRNIIINTYWNNLVRARLAGMEGEITRSVETKPITKSDPTGSPKRSFYLPSKGMIDPDGAQGNPMPNKYHRDIIKDKVRSFIADKGIDNIVEKVSADKLIAASIAHSENFYEQLYNLASPQIDVMSTPMFRHSLLSDIGQDMFLLAKQPTILGGIDYLDIDALALGAGEEIEERKRLYSSFMTGLYKMMAFEHRITKSSIDSHFRLVKTSNTVSKAEIEAHQNLLKRRAKVEEDLKAGKSFGEIFKNFFMADDGMKMGTGK